MNKFQKEYFRRKLLNWKKELFDEGQETLLKLQEHSKPGPDLGDRAFIESDRTLDLRTRDRARKLVTKIDAALERIDNGTFGYCEETNEPIGVKRLDARPIATLSLEAQERHERMEKTQLDS